MSSPNVQRSVLRYLTAALAMTLLAACGGEDKKNKRSQASCENGLASGQMQATTLYRSEFAPFGESCQQFAFEGQVACDAGNLSYLSGGVPSCEETRLEKLLITADRKQIEIGQTLAMELIGTDQRGGTFKIDPRKARWSSSSATTTVSDSGLVTGTELVPDVAISATVDLDEDSVLRVEYRLSVTGRNCEGTQHGLKKEFSRFKAEKVPFNARCEEVKAEATCVNGKFEFEAGISETCSVAALTALEADPSSLFLIQGETAPVSLFLVDELSTRIPVEASAAQWTFPQDQLSQQNGQLTALVALAGEVKVQVSAEGFNTEITVAPRTAQPDGLRFEQNDLLMKQGDEVELKVLSTTGAQVQALDPKRLTWESSDPSQVSVVEGKVKALTAGATVSITAKLDQLAVSTQVRVEEVLSIDAKLIEGAQLTVDKPRLLPAAVATIAGPMQAGAPELKQASEGCSFSIQKNRRVWELDVVLNEEAESIPGVCEVEIALSSAAGQQASQKVSVPVDYRRFKYEDLISEGKDGRFDVGQLNYKLSKNLSIVKADTTKFSQSEIAPADCTLSLEQGQNSYLVVVNRTAEPTEPCNGYLRLEIKKEGVARNSNHFELITQSQEKTFLQHCQSPGNSGIAATVRAIRNEISPSSSCEKLQELLREKNLYSAGNDDTKFSLALANKGLTNLEPLARFVGLEELDLAANRELSDVAPLAGLKLLELLNIKATKVSDLSPLYKHTRMTDLRIPAQLSVACSDSIVNPQLKKVCQ